MNEIVNFPFRESGRETPDRILKGALDWEDMEDVIVIANCGGDVCVAGTYAETIEVLGLIELAKHKLIIDQDET